MKRRIFLLPLLLVFLSPWLAWTGLRESPPQTVAQAQRLAEQGNFKEAAEIFLALARQADTPPGDAAACIPAASACLQRLNRTAEIDAFLEQAVALHASRFEVLLAAALTLESLPHSGVIVAGEFQRGPHRGRARWVNSFERDRVRALQLLVEASGLLQGEFDRAKAGELFRLTARLLMGERGFQESWRLQYLTDLSELPDFDEGRYRQGLGSNRGAPVDEKGEPVFHRLPQSWEAARTDGERWRFALLQAMEMEPAKKNEVLLHLADFLHGQFGVHTLAGMLRMDGEDLGERRSGLLALHTLSEEETIARLATGIKRFALPSEFNFIRIFRENGAHFRLAQVFENRRQFPKAAEQWELAQNKERVDQIRNPWARFEPAPTQPAGEGGALRLRYRNARKVGLEAREIKVAELLNDVKAYLKSNPGRLDWKKMAVDAVGMELLDKEREKYIGEKRASWELELEPPAGHFDKVIQIATPLQRPGAYLVGARVEGGNTSHVVLWIADTVIVKKPMAGHTLYFVADALTGEPVAKANLELFGYRQQWVRNLIGSGGRYTVSTQNFAESTDENGLATPKQADQDGRFTWLAIATTPAGRLAHQGFSNVWYPRADSATLSRARSFVITDRPVYRPEQTVQFKFWINQARYDAEGKSPFAGQEFQVEINDPLGEKILEAKFTADEFGGFEGRLPLKKDARLGRYRIRLPKAPGGSSTFLVEEYKKPEFEVEVEAPADPIRLGDKLEAKISARYYFGAPVSKGTVSYKVLRTPFSADWHPPRRWDWLYGSGYWWFGYDYAWYPGWEAWGSPRPRPWWWSRVTAQPELVAEGEAPLAPDGTLAIPIDTSIAKELHGTQDHRYSITAEVRDESRRIIVGSGAVIAARRPFKVHVWLERGHFRAGDAVTARFAAHRPDGKPVQARGEARLFELAYDRQGKPIETLLQSWPAETDEQGSGRLQFTAAAQGQYRLSLTLPAPGDTTIEGACLLNVTGPGFDGSDFRFDDLELVPDKPEYAPGETVRLMVNSDRAGAPVLLFPRAENGRYEKPTLLRLEGKSALRELPVLKGDMPNFFVEALTVRAGRVFTEIRQIAVPPESRVLDVAIKPNSEKYKPGEKAMLTVLLTDATGEPYAGAAVLTLYDKAVEYISGGSNVPDIKDFFWKWRRNHNPRTEHSLARSGGNLAVGPTLVPLGVFGHLEHWGPIDEEEVRDGALGFGGRNAEKAGAPPAPGAAPQGLGDFGAEGGEQLRRARGGGAPMAEARSQAEEPEASLAEATVRTQFADTALWAGSILTGPDGTARLELVMPENLTTWKARVWAMGLGARVGEAETEVVTTKNLLLRLQAPRFFVQKDEVVLSANVHNYLSSEKRVKVLLELEGGCLEPMDSPLAQTVAVAANGETRVDWRVRALQPGSATIRMKALTDEESDATQMSFPVLVHGMLKLDSFCGVIRPEQASASLQMRVPEERLPEQTRLEIRYSPTLAYAMLDALPYLAAFPYGCTEQTLNRFLPTVITQKVLQRMGVDLAAIQKKRTNLNPQEIGDDRARAEQWRRFKENPVFDEEQLRDMVKAGLQALGSMQCSDGGWGWFSGFGERSWPHTTAVVVHGLQIAVENDVALVPGLLERGLEWLQRYQAGELKKLENGLLEPPVEPYKRHADNTDALVLRVLADAKHDNPKLRERLYQDRNVLSVYGKALLGLACHRLGDAEKRDMLLRNIEQFLQQDEENQSAWLNLGNRGYWWNWYGCEIEAHAAFLQLLLAVRPADPVAPRLVKYLLNNRKHATWWNSTRDTALCLEAFADYLKATGEDKPDLTVEIRVDGKTLKTVHISPENLFTYDNALVLSGLEVASGTRAVELVKTGKGPLYFNAYLTNFTLEDPIPPAGLEIKIERRYFRLVPVQKSVKAAGDRGQVVDQRVEKYTREPLASLAALTSGDLLEIELVIESKNDYEYIQIEDMKAAGCEPFEVRSGYGGNEMGAYVELRDERVCLFLRTLARGKHSVSYRMRAEIPGAFSALPAKASAMYAPELKANSSETKVRIVDRQ